MTPDIALLGTVAVELSAFGLYNKARIRREEASAQKYRLYKVRDDLVYLVAIEKLSEDEELFELFYGFTNHLIKTTKQTLSLKTFMEALTTAEEDPAEEEQLQRVISELKRKDAEVVQTIDSLFSAVTEILLENSYTLRLAYGLNSFWSSTTELLRPWVDRLLPEPDAYRIYRQYSRASQLIHA